MRTFIQLKTTKEEIEEFESSIAFYFPDALTFESHPREISLGPNRIETLYSNRYVFFDCFSKSIFPILSQSRHYLNTLEEIDIHLMINPHKAKDLNFLGELMNYSALIPYLKSLRFRFSAKVEMQDFEDSELAG